MEKIKLEVKWGVIFVLTSMLWMFIEKMMGWHGEHIDQQRYMTNLFIVPATLVFVYALRDKRNQLQGEISWKQGFMAGMIITSVIFMMSPVSLWVSLNLISPEFFPNMISFTVSREILDQETAEAYFNFRNYVIQSALGAFVMGTITSAAVAFFIKNKKA
ncbi:DUF4199 domain-containing protein [bacterium]|nr:MAG: DUF4199 domain-containing protein [bacterium]